MLRRTNEKTPSPVFEHKKGAPRFGVLVYRSTNGALGMRLWKRLQNRDVRRYYARNTLRVLEVFLLPTVIVVSLFLVKNWFTN